MVYLLFIVMGVWIFTLQNRITELEIEAKKKEAFKQQTHSANAVAIPPRVQSGVEAPVHSPIPQQVTQLIAPSSITFANPTEKPAFDLVAWFKQGFLIKFGGLLLFLGVAWFVSYAFSQGWIPPTVRILLGFLIACVMYVLSHLRVHRDLPQAIILNALGTGIIIAVITAAQFVYEMFPSAVALGIMVLAITYTTYVSIRVNHQVLAVLAAVLGLVAPLLTNESEPDMASFFLYLLVFSLAFIWVAAKQGWTSLTLALLIGIGLYELGYSGSTLPAETTTFLVFAFLFNMVFYSASLIGGVLKNKTFTGDVYVGGINSLLALFWIHTIVPEPLHAFSALVVACIAGATVYMLYEQKHAPTLVYLHGAIAAVFVVSATAYAFEGFTLVLMFALEAGLVIAASILSGFRKDIVSIAALSYTLPVLLSLESFFSAEWNVSMFHSDAYALYGVTGVAITLAVLAYVRKYTVICRGFTAVAWVYLALLMHLIIGAYIAESVDTSIVLITYAAFSAFSVMASVYLRAEKTIIGIFVATFGLSILPALSLLLSYDIWRDGWLHIHFVSIAYLVSILLCMAYFFFVTCTMNEDRTLMVDYMKGFCITAGLLGAGLIWQTAHAAFERSDVAVMVALFVYVTCGLTLYVLGKLLSKKELVIGSGVILGAVVVRLLVIDVWQMEILWRVITFVSIGGLFITTSFFESGNLRELARTKEG